MDKNTLLAVVLSAVLLIGGFLVIQFVFPAKPVPPAEQPVSQETHEQNGTPQAAQTDVLEKASAGEGDTVQLAGPAEDTGTEAVQLQTIEAHTGVFDMVFTNKGAAIESLLLRDHTDSKTGENVQMIITDQGDAAFKMRFGDTEGKIIDDIFHVGDINYDRNNNLESIEFWNVYLDKEGSKFKLTKTYRFSADEYLFEIVVNIKKLENISTPIMFNNKTAYTLFYGPQIGPQGQDLGKASRLGEYRRYYSYSGKKRKTVKIKKGSIYSEGEVKLYWASIVGRYFALIAVPGYKTGGTINTVFTEEHGGPASLISEMSFERSGITTIESTDKYDFYMGPKLSAQLKRYNSEEKNAFELTNMGMDKIIDSGGIFALFEWLLRQGLMLFYKLIPNYGVAIILVTLLIKLILYPFTRKSLHSTSKMQALNPLVNELKEKYKDNPQKMNAEMAALYKREGVNPLGGCLPLLLQMPILIGFFQLLQKQFELRGAPFFGWITDLSLPDSIYTFNASIPLLGSDIRLLPILYVVTQLLSTKLTQMATHTAAPANKNMKFMQYGLPLVFFFLFYGYPSGLLIYWITTNLATGIQQYYIQRKMGKNKEV